MAQYGLPVSDVVTGATQCAGDGNATMWEELDEGFGAGRGTGSGPDDTTTYWNGNSNDTGRASNQMRCALGALTDPVSSTGHIIRSRNVKLSVCTASASGVQIDLTVVLLQGTTDIASTTFANLSSSWVTTSYTLSGSEADSITNYADLKIENYKTDVGGGAGRRVGWSAGELEIPDTVIPSIYGRPFGRLGQSGMQQILIR